MQPTDIFDVKNTVLTKLILVSKRLAIALSKDLSENTFAVEGTTDLASPGIVNEMADALAAIDFVQQSLQMDPRTPPPRPRQVSNCVWLLSALESLGQVAFDLCQHPYDNGDDWLRLGGFMATVSESIALEISSLDSILSAIVGGPSQVGGYVAARRSEKLAIYCKGTP